MSQCSCSYCGRFTQQLFYAVSLKSDEFSSSEVSHQGVEQGFRQDKKQLEKNNGKQVKKPAAITKSKRRKLERVKAPVTILRKMKQVEGKYHYGNKITCNYQLNYMIVRFSAVISVPLFNVSLVSQSKPTA